MAWFFLIVAGVLEIVWVVGLKYSDGLKRPFPAAFALVIAMISLGFLAQAAKTLHLGTAYAVWTGIGIGGAVLAGNLIFGESLDGAQLACIGLILGGIVGLKLLTAG